VTTATIQLALWWRSLSLETRQSVTRWALVGLALAGVAAVMPTLIRSLGALATVASLLLSPWVAIPVAIVGVAAALLYLTAEGDTFAQKMESVADRVVLAFFGIKAAARLVSEQISELFGGKGKDESFAERMRKILGQVSGNQLLTDLAAKAIGREDPNNMVDRTKRIWAEEMKQAEQWRKMAKAGVKDVAGALGKLGEGQGFHIKLNVEFESLQGTFDRLQKAFANDDPFNVMQAQLNEQKKAAAELEKANQKLGNIDQKLPVVR
jgi:hypothetical protein